MEVSCRRMSLFLKDTHESYDSLRPLSNVCSFVQLHTAQAHCTTSHTSDRPRNLAARGTGPRPPPSGRATAVAH